ncbi:Transketolase 1 [Cucumispora dikerogammari]|nr:Transketolase 1 [Cucumispora dikerogammari]
MNQKTTDKNFIEKLIKNIRFNCALTVENAGCGHPGAPLALAPLLLCLFSNHLKFDPKDPDCLIRDVFLMSNGHSCVIHYVMLDLIKYIKPNELKNFRQLHSQTPGHPEKLMTPGIELSAGPLGQGVANAVGFAIAFKKKGLNQHVYCTFGDGCYQEGMSQEAFSLASHLNLNNITFIYDSNKVTIEGSTDISMSDDPIKRFEGLNFEIIEISNDFEQINTALSTKTEKVKMIILNTKIAEGSSLAGSHLTHGFPLGMNVVEEFRDEGVQDFQYSEQTYVFFRALLIEKAKEIESLKEKYKREIEKLPTKCSPKEIDFYKNLTQTYKAKLQKSTEKKDLPTRRHFQLAISEVYHEFPLIGGSADLTPSNLSMASQAKSFTRTNIDGCYVHWGIREHAMFGALNGIASDGTYIPYAATFMNFATYGLGALRMAALDNLHVCFVMTHDSIGLGEDGPTHMPIEVLAFLRAVPRLYVFRPADGLETRLCLRYCLENKIPSVLSLSRHNIPEIDETNENTLKGCYLLINNNNPVVTIMATGSEVHIARDVCIKLNKENIVCNLVSAPCLELFDKQDEEYKKSVLKGRIVSLEAQSTYGWYKYAELAIGVDSFGVSCSQKVAYEHFGLTVEAITDKIICEFKLKSIL